MEVSEDRLRGVLRSAVLIGAAFENKFLVPGDKELDVIKDLIETMVEDLKEH